MKNNEDLKFTGILFAILIVLVSLIAHAASILGHTLKSYSLNELDAVVIVVCAYLIFKKPIMPKQEKQITKIKLPK